MCLQTQRYQHLNDVVLTFTVRHEKRTPLLRGGGGGVGGEERTQRLIAITINGVDNFDSSAVLQLLSV